MTIEIIIDGDDLESAIGAIVEEKVEDHDFESSMRDIAREEMPDTDEFITRDELDACSISEVASFLEGELENLPTRGNRCSFGRAFQGAVETIVGEAVGEELPSQVRELEATVRQLTTQVAQLLAVNERLVLALVPEIAPTTTPEERVYGPLAGFTVGERPNGQVGVGHVG